MNRWFGSKQSRAWLRRPLVRSLLIIGAFGLMWRWEFAPATAAAACARAGAPWAVAAARPARTVGRVMRSGAVWQLLEVSDPCHAPGACLAVWTPFGWKVLDHGQNHRLCMERLGP
ncbi:MAG TPA: hypothetical protein VGE07_18670 [Herpetosiphonaceae bacterium]